VEEEKLIEDLDLDARYIQTNEFYRVAKELFQFDRNKGENYNQKKKNCLEFYSFNLPVEFNNYFIRLEDAPLFFTFGTKFLLYLEEFLRFNFPQKVYGNYYQLIKDFYYKWNQVKYPEEKRYFASSILNYYERDSNKNNFLSSVFTGIIFCFDSNVRNVASGLYLFNKTTQIIDGLKLNENNKKELQCLIEIYSGFGNLLIMKYEEAKESFNRALSINPTSITAKYYLAYSESKLTYYNITEKLITEIFEYDISRLSYTIESNNPLVFNYFLNNLLFKNIFYEEIFADNLSTILKVIQVQKNELSIHPKELLLLMDDLKKIELKNIEKEKTKKELENIDEMLRLNIDSKNILLLKVFPTIINKIKSIIELIVESIKSCYLEEIKENLFPLDKEIQEKLNNISQLRTELEETKKQSKSNLEESTTNEERESLYNIKLIEGKIENLSLESKYNPMNAFKNTMMYTIIISFISSLLGGCAGYSNMYIKSSGELNYILSAIIINGFKWGIFALFIGFLISVFTASVSIIERSNKKQKLLARIKYLKNKSEIEKQRLQERFQAKEKSMIDNLNDRISDLQNRIENIRQSKKSLEVQLRNGAESKIAEETEPFRLIIEKFG